MDYKTAGVNIDAGNEAVRRIRTLAVLTIGNDVSMPEILGLAAGSQRGLTTAGEPFGGSLEPHVWFGDALIAGGITHYRWSYRRLGSSGAPSAAVTTPTLPCGTSVAFATETRKRYGCMGHRPGGSVRS